MPTKRPNILYADKVVATATTNAAIAATTSLPLCSVDGDTRVDKFEIAVPGGYVTDPANYYVVTLQQGATVLATYSLLTGAQASLTTLVFGNAVLAAVPVATLAVATQLNVVLTKVGAAVNFPAGSQFVAHLKQLTNS